MTVRQLAVIGAGAHASTNILPACVLADVRVQALATRDLDRSRAALRRCGSDGTAYDDADALLADATVRDVVVVAQPADQLRIARAAVRAGKNVLVDKPLGWTAAEAAEIARDADEHGTVLMVGFMKRYAPVYRRLHDLLDDGGLGTVRSFHLTFACDSTSFCADVEEFVKLAAIHVIDLVRWLFGEIDDVRAVSSGSGAHVALSVLVRTRAGLAGTLELSGLPGCSSEVETLRVTGDDGWAVAEDVARLSVHTRTANDEPSWRDQSERMTVHSPAESTMSGGGRDLYLRGFVGEIDEFVACVRERREPASSGRDNVATMTLVEQILTAAAAR